jgi:hypothetical protein
MKAIVCTKYGSLDVLHLQEVAKPAPRMMKWQSICIVRARIAWYSLTG